MFKTKDFFNKSTKDYDPTRDCKDTVTMICSYKMEYPVKKYNDHPSSPSWYYERYKSYSWKQRHSKCYNFDYCDFYILEKHFVCQFCHWLSFSKNIISFVDVLFSWVQDENLDSMGHRIFFKILTKIWKN